MKTFVFLMTLLMPTQLVARDVTGVWSTGERFRAEIVQGNEAPRSYGLFFESDLRIYSIDDDGNETVIFEKLQMYQESGRWNEATARVGILLGPDNTLVINKIRSSVRGRGVRSSSIRIAKHDEQLVVENYKSRNGENGYMFTASGSSIQTSHQIECNVDLKTGQRTIDGQTDMIGQPGTIKLEDWTEETAYELNLCPFNQSPYVFHLYSRD